MNNIILIGFMGCGKTTIGKRLAEEFSMEYYDIDAFIEESTKMTIPEGSGGICAYLRHRCRQPCNCNRRRNS